MSVFNLINLIMQKILKVIKPFHVMEIGDEFVLSQNGKEYESNYTEEYNGNNEDNDIASTYTSNFVISLEYAKALINEGYLEEVKPKETFINVFNEIDKMIKTYEIDLKNLDEDCSTYPACLKLEKETVIKNLLQVLNYLKQLNTKEKK